jgi:Icc-related predicted phosphoesterase
VIHIAAVGDIHVGVDDGGRIRPAYEDISERADVLLLAGDLTQLGSAAEARVVADEFADLGLPVVTVLGNHDYHSDEPTEVAKVLSEKGIVVLEGDSTMVSVGTASLGVAGVKGFGGGFAGRCASGFGEPQMKRFVATSEEAAAALRQALEGLHTDYRIALTHYSPVADTLSGEPVEIYPFLGSYLLAEAIDSAGADLALHGHAHHGVEHGATDGGVRVRNVARPVIGRAYALYSLADKPVTDAVRVGQN